MNVHSDHAHGGDCIWSLTALYRMGGEHTLRCKAEYVTALRELVAGTGITIEDCSHVPPDSRDFWIASGLFEHRGIRYQDDKDIMGFVQRYFNAMAEDGGYAPCFPSREDMLCSFPSVVMQEPSQTARVLVINADPKSGQCPRYSSSEMDQLISRLEDRWESVISIEKAGLSLAEIGRIATYAELIIGCATGPWWPTMRVNTYADRICMLDPMRLDYGPNVPITHARDAAEVAAILESRDML